MSQQSKPSNARKIEHTLTRRDLVADVARRTRRPESEVSEIVDATLDSLSKLIRSANPEIRIELRGLGVFEVKYMKPAAAVRDPRTGESVSYSGRRRKVHFRPSKLIKRFFQKDISIIRKPDDDHQEAHSGN
ncbi:MAG: HU family DNA-binding protein [Chloroherpetonaceae bacterium]|nr:HU family DNA-binding protein [Chloroherpetonaceae bacterium]MCS7211416.1 HU family DNA-binding protein [Chloroherpetonaceae bacterium]MDW8018842.1 HU family DNA-binding protein [Chloroherpetonaceae bacterium]MDW8466713.1 HU family DNA-binding protein [Chloroherpetonaceae bacterium]